jgi:Fe-Mn family superoxide dismutase
MEAKTYKEYVTEVKRWAENVQQMMVDAGLSSEVYSSWEQEMKGFIQNLEAKLVQEEVGIAQNDAEDLERAAKEMYERSQAILGDQNDGRGIFIPDDSVPIGGHRLPPLPYSYDALEPYIAKEIMVLHHDKHHQSYVDGLNKAEKAMAEARKTGDFSLLKHWEREAAFHGSGHYLHTIFWNNMSPNGGGTPSGRLKNQIEQDFGSFSAFQNHFKEAAKQVEGVGWALLVWAPRSHRLEVLQTEKHQFFTQWDTIPLLVLDVWEHAYYLQYKTDRADYIKNWWNVVNWDDVEKRFDQASKLTWKPF